MSNPVSRIDIFVEGESASKIGEMTVNDDFTLEGFLFEEAGEIVKSELEKGVSSFVFSLNVE